MKNIFLILSFLAATSLNGLYSQEIKTIQPKIMVLPWVREGQDMRSTIEDDPNMRTAITVTMDAFLKRGYQTEDFVTKFRAEASAAGMTRDAQTSIKEKIIKNSGADIIVTIDPVVVPGSGCQKVRINITANDAYSGSNMAAKNPESMCINTTDVGKLMEKALEDTQKGLDVFLAQLNESFGRIVENGRDVNLRIEVKKDSPRKLTDDIDDDFNTLNSVIEAWGLKIAYKGYANAIKTDVHFEFSPIRVPLRDPVTNANFNIDENLIKALRRELKNRGITTESGSSVGGVYYLYIL